MNPAVFSGVGVALVTLFDDGGELDTKATAEHAAQLVELGVRGVVVAGTTGEAAALSPEERIELVAAVRAAVPSEVPVLAGSGAPAARQAVALTLRLADAGADGLLVLSPPRTADPRPYYDQVAAAAGDLPVLAYHFPNVAPPGVPVELLADLPVAGLKDSTGDPERLLEELAVLPGALYSGSSALLAFAGPVGCHGAILALANVEPERCAAAFAGDAHAQRALTDAHLASRRSFPHGLKALVAARFGTPVGARIG